MSKYRIVLYGEKALRDKNREVKEVTDEIRQLVQDMFDDIEDKGIGLAAPQIGINKKIAVIRFKDEEEDIKYALINPEIYEYSDDTWEEEEGCLSFPELYFKVKRSNKIKVRYCDLDMKEHDIELEGWPARVFQHELDHLEGVLFIDRISDMKRRLIHKNLMKIKAMIPKDENEVDKEKDKKRNQLKAKIAKKKKKKKRK